MYGKVIYSEFLKFDFLADINVQINLKCSYDFKAQAPNNIEDEIRAVLVSFDADSEGDTVHFHARCRVVFDLREVTAMPDEETFIAQNYRIAYQEFAKKANEVMEILGQNPFVFEEI